MFRFLTRKRVAAGAAAIAALAAVITLVARGGDEESTAQETAGTGAAVVERRDLVETEDMDGTLGYADTREVVNRLAGTVTWLPDVGSVVKPGERLFEIDDEPVYLLDGRKPAFRTLEPGLSGSDVRQLERNLRRLGYDSGSAITVDGEWDSGTTAAVYRWQEKTGLDVTGVIELGRVVFQPGRRRVADLAVTLGDSGAGGGSSSSAAAADTAKDPTASANASGRAQMTFAALRTSTERPAASVATAAQDECDPKSPTEESETPADSSPETCDVEQDEESAPEEEPPETNAPTEDEPAQAEGRQQRQAPAPQVSAAARSTAATSGEAATETAQTTSVLTTVMTTTATRRRVKVEMPTDRIDLARERDRVEVELPSGDRVDGRISSVGRVATLPEGEDVSASDATIDVSIRLSERSGSVLDQAPVTVSFERSRAKDVLTVPVTALLARSGGTFAVEVREGQERRVLSVETGLYTDGLVEISGEGLREGMTITDSGL